MEEKKDNKGLLVGIIIFLIICLVAIFYFMFKMTYVENKDNTNNNTSESEQKETTNQEEGFTELTKYELQEGEEKEITIKNKTIKLKRKDDKYYINDKEVESNIPIIKAYVTNKIILFEKGPGQFGATYIVYDLDGNKIDIEAEEAQYNNLRCENGKLMVDAFIFKTHWTEGYRIGNLLTEPEGMGKCSKKLSDYPNIIEEHKEDVLEANYYFDYTNNKLILKVDEVKLTVAELAKDASKICVSESN